MGCGRWTDGAVGMEDTVRTVENAVCQSGSERPSPQPFAAAVATGVHGSTLCYMLHRLLDFREVEVQSVAEMYGVSKEQLNLRFLPDDHPYSPFRLVDLPSDDVARKVIRRTHLTKVQSPLENSICLEALIWALPTTALPARIALQHLPQASVSTQACLPVPCMLRPGRQSELADAMCQGQYAADKGQHAIRPRATCNHLSKRLPSAPVAQ